jgi:hypothetical protein
MSAVVIDTNVLLVADGQAQQMSPKCKIECLSRLEKAKASERVVLDNQRIILSEYGHKLDASKRPPSAGSAFLKWLCVNLANDRYVSLVNLSPLDTGKTKFKEFPLDRALEDLVDPSDRKFMAAAFTHPEKPPILESADSKWLGWEADLKRHGIKLEVLCRCELEAIRSRKTGAAT